MSDNNEQLVVVRRQPGSHMTAVYKCSDVSGLRWDKISGGVKKTFFNKYFMYGYVQCDEAVEGQVAHSGIHGPCPHKIKVCILKGDNAKSIYKSLEDELPPSPQQARSRPTTGNTCKVDIIDVIEKKMPIKRSDLIDILYEIGHGENNIKRILRILANEKIIVWEKPQTGRGPMQYRLGPKAASQTLENK